MSQFTPINIPEENNLPLVIHFTRTSPTFSRQARIEALEVLIDRCSRAIETCLEATDAALATIDEGDKHRASLNKIRADLPADVHRNLAEMTDAVRARGREELEVIGSNLRTLMSCKREAQQGLAETRRTA
ncbi:hypothetical protein MMC22_006712 [Lobaria immixta]|nr:hypothetical protein [Lobaria immixta]